MVDEFKTYRARMNQRLLSTDSLIIKRLMHIDSSAYTEKGGLSVKHKELLGLTASIMLRCDDCVKYHIERVIDEGANMQEITEALEISFVVGGSIMIPHLRRAYEYLDAYLSYLERDQTQEC